MKKLLLLIVSAFLIAGCEKVKNEVAKRTLTFDDIKGMYRGSIYEDLPSATGGITSILYSDTLLIAMEGTEIVLTSRAIGRIKVTTGNVTDSTFQLFVPEQSNGKTDSMGLPYLTAKDGSDLTIFKPTLDQARYEFKKDTIGKDPEDGGNVCMTRYRVVSLEK